MRWIVTSDFAEFAQCVTEQIEGFAAEVRELRKSLEEGQSALDLVKMDIDQLWRRSCDLRHGKVSYRVAADLDRQTVIYREPVHDEEVLL